MIKRKIGSEGDIPLSSTPKGADGDQVKTEVTEGIFLWGEVNPNSTAPEMRPNYNYPLVAGPEVSAKVTSVSFEPGARTEWNLPQIPWTW